MEDFNNSIQSELHKISALVGMTLECKTDADNLETMATYWPHSLIQAIKKPLRQNRKWLI